MTFLSLKNINLYPHHRFIFISSNNFVLNYSKTASSVNDNYRKIKLRNEFPFTISLFFDNEAEYGKNSVIGDYLDDLGTNADIDILALTGHTVFATEVNGLSRIDVKTFKANVNQYVFGEGKKDMFKVVSEAVKEKERRSEAMKKLYPTSVKNFVEDREKQEMTANLPNEEPSDQKEVKRLMMAQKEEIKKGGYREADARGKLAAVGARMNPKNEPAKSPSRDDVYNKHMEKHKNAFGKEFFLEVTNLSHKTVVSHQTEEGHRQNAELVQAAWARLRTVDRKSLRQVAPSDRTGLVLN